MSFRSRRAGGRCFESTRVPLMLSLSLFLSRSLLVPVVTVAVAVGLAAGAAGCTKAGRSVVQVQVVPGGVAGVTKVEIVVTPVGGGRSPTPQGFTDLDFSVPQTLGVFVDSSITGQVGVQAKGYAGSTIVASSASMTATIVAGKASELVVLTLSAVTPGDGSGGAGAGGAAGSATGGAKGSGGAGGATSTGGAGGTMVGSGGAAGGPAGSGGAGGGGPGVGGAGGQPPGGKAWQGAMLAENNTLQEDTLPSIAVDAKGNAVVVYQHGYVLWSNYYTATTGTWGTPGPVDGRADSDASWGSVAVDKNGKYLAVWQQGSGKTIHGIWQSTSTDGVHWSEPAAVATTGNLFTPHMAMNDDGVAAVVWVENVPPNNTFQVNGSVRAANGTWSAPHVLKTAADSSDRNPAVVVTGQGDVAVAWEQVDDRPSNSQTSVWLVRYTGGAWGTPALVESYDTSWASNAGLATNKAGQLVVTWVQYVNSTELWSRRYSPTGTADPPVLIGEPADITWDPAPSVVLDEMGNATVAMAITSKGTVQAYTSRAAWGQAWSAPMAMETDNQAAENRLNEGEYVITPQLARDGAGNVFLIWTKRVDLGMGPDPTNPSKTRFLYRWDLYSRIYDAASSTWGAPKRLEDRDMDSKTPPRITNVFGEKINVNPSGVAAVTWYYGWDLDVWANIYK